MTLGAQHGTIRLGDTSVGDPLGQLRALCEAERWCEAFDAWRAYPTLMLRDEATDRDDWLAFLCGETRLLHHACAQAVAHRETASIRDWYDSLRPHKQGEVRAKSLYARFTVIQLSAQHKDAVTDLIKAAGLAVMARAIAEATQPLSAIENLCGWFDGVPLDEPVDASTGRRLAALSGPADVLDALLDVHRQKASHPVQAIRLAHIWECARTWLGVPKQVTGAARQVPIAYVLGDGEQGRVDETLVVDIVEPGTGMAFQHADDVLLLPPAGTHAQAASDQPQSHGFG